MRFTAPLNVLFVLTFTLGCQGRVIALGLGADGGLGGGPPGPGSNNTLAVDAGPAQTLAFPVALPLVASVTENSVPASSSVGVIWSTQSGAGTVTFANPAAAATTATFSALGNYVLQATATDGSASAIGTLQVTVNAPTVSSWLGTNVDGDLPRVDIGYQLTPFPDAGPGTLDPNGYPAPGDTSTSSTDIGFVLPSGAYKISFTGTGTLSVSGIGSVAGPWQSVNGEQRNTVNITGTPGAFGNFLNLKVTNTPGTTVQNIHLYYPGYDYDTQDIFLPQFLSLLQPFKALRFMDWMATNNSTLAAWADRPNAAHFGASPNGQPYEHIVALVNQTGKDLWVNLPELATDDFTRQFADFLRDGLNYGQIDSLRRQAGIAAPFQILFETSNETWNGGFSGFGTFLDAGLANPSRYSPDYDGGYGPTWMYPPYGGIPGGQLMSVGKYEADRLVGQVAIFRQEFATIGKQGILSPVLSGWAQGAAYSDDGLRFIAQNYGTPSSYIKYVALAPYFGPDDTQTGALDTLFSAAETNIQSMDAVFGDFERLAAQYGIQIAAYEGGQGLSGATNQPIKHLAQHDARMRQTYLDYLQFWNAHFGDALFMHFTLAGTVGTPEFIFQYGFWGSTETVMDDPTTCGKNLPTLAGTEMLASVVQNCPKYEALAEQIQMAPDGG